MCLFEKDKEIHLILGFIIAYIAFFCMMLLTTINPWMILGISGVLSIVGSAVKELVYDKWLGKGVPSWKDFYAGCAGDVLFIVVTSLLLLNCGI